jgi:hypothetical protein
MTDDILLVSNALVGHIWRRMPEMNVFRNWYRGQGAFVRKHPEIQVFVRSYFREIYPTVAFATLCSAIDRLLRSALVAEGFKAETSGQTLPQLLQFCVSARHRFLNLWGMCCDIRSIYCINSIRIGAEHGDHQRDFAELSQFGWRPADPDEAYEEIITHRLLSPHLQLCDIFNRVDPETGRFFGEWEPRGFAQCVAAAGSHDANGRLPADKEKGVQR